MDAVCVISVHDVDELLIVQVTLVGPPSTRSEQMSDWPVPGALATTQPRFLKVPPIATYLLTVSSVADADGHRPSSA